MEIVMGSNAGVEICCMQVTNPPIDPLREGLVMSLNMRLGKRGNLLQATENAYSQVLPLPLLRISCQLAFQCRPY